MRHSMSIVAEKNNRQRTSLELRNRKLDLLSEALLAVAVEDEEWLDMIDEKLEDIERIENRTTPHKHITILLRNYNRVSQIFDDYRIKLTGPVESRKDSRLYDFIYRAQPNHQSEILDVMYQQGVIDGLKIALS